MKPMVSSSPKVKANRTSTSRNVIADIAKAVQAIIDKAIADAGNPITDVSLASRSVSEYGQTNLPPLEPGQSLDQVLDEFLNQPFQVTHAPCGARDWAEGFQSNLVPLDASSGCLVNLTAWLGPGMPVVNVPGTLNLSGGGGVGGGGSPGSRSFKERIQEAFDDLANFRSTVVLFPRTSEADPTVGRLDIGGRTFYGTSRHGRRLTIKVNATTRDHAEADVFQQALDEGVTAPTAQLYVDRGLCDSCGVKGGLGTLMRATGVKYLVVYTPDGRAYRITAQRPSVPIPIGSWR
jgi:MafB19-like deaminase